MAGCSCCFMAHFGAECDTFIFRSFLGIYCRKITASMIEHVNQLRVCVCFSMQIEMKNKRIEFFFASFEIRIRKFPNPNGKPTGKKKHKRKMVRYHTSNSIENSKLFARLFDHHVKINWNRFADIFVAIIIIIAFRCCRHSVENTQFPCNFV